MYIASKFWFILHGMLWILDSVSPRMLNLEEFDY